jgi:osmotically-inducible protein OsmY
MQGTRILQLPVENLQGKVLGRVKTLTYLDGKTGRFTGVVVGEKIVPPEALRYNFSHTALRINNHEESFSDTAAMKVSSDGTFTTMGTTARPGNPLPALRQGNSVRDKAITEQITNRISSSLSLSHYAKNIQVGTVQGKTTLRGRVESQKEKNQIEGFSLQAAGAGRVDNLLQVSPLNARDKAVDQDL